MMRPDSVREGKSGHPKTATVVTTLYDLIEAISEEMKSGEDSLVVQTVLHLIDTGKLKFLTVPQHFNPHHVI